MIFELQKPTCPQIRQADAFHYDREIIKVLKTFKSTKDAMREENYDQ